MNQLERHVPGRKASATRARAFSLHRSTDKNVDRVGGTVEPIGVSVIGFALSQTRGRGMRAKGRVYKSGRGASLANLWNVAPKGALESGKRP